MCDNFLYLKIIELPQYIIVREYGNEGVSHKFDIADTRSYIEITRCAKISDRVKRSIIHNNRHTIIRQNHATIAIDIKPSHTDHGSNRRIIPNISLVHIHFEQSGR